MRRKYSGNWIRLGGLLLALIFVLLSFRYFHAERFWEETREFFIGNPLILFIVTACYLFSFCLRAEAWRIYLGKTVCYSSCLQGVLLSLFVNHITPIKAGDVVRVGVLSWREKNITPEVSAHSVIVLRVLDMLVLLLFSFIGLLAFSRIFLLQFSLWVVITLFVFGLISIILFLKYRPQFLMKHVNLLKRGFSGKNFRYILTLIVISWVLEGAVVWGVTTSLGNQLPFIQAVWINSITVGGQVFQITPGGISTYESVMTAALTSFHYPVKDGYMVALISHSYKFIFSYLSGLLLLIHSPITKMKQIKELLLLRRE